MQRGPDGASPYARPKPTAPKTAAPNRSSLHKQAVVYAAEQNLKPWEVQKPPKQPAPAPFKAAPARQAPLRTRYKAALGAPVNAPIKVGGKTVPARQYLADTMTPKRRAEYHQSLVPPPPKPKGGLLNAIEQTPGSIAHNLLGYGKTSAAVGKYVAKQASGQGTYTERPLSQSLQLPAKAALGNSLYNALTQGQTSHLGAAGLEAATIFPFFRAGRLVKDAAEAAKAAEAEKAVSAVPAVGRDALRQQFLSAGPEERTRILEQMGIRRKTAPVAEKSVPNTPAAAADQSGSAYAKEIPTETAPTLEQGAKELMAGMPEATRGRLKIKALRKPEYAARSSEVKRLMDQIPGEAGLAAARASMRGEMPTLRWGRFTEMNQETVDAMDAHIRQMPELKDRPLTMANTTEALYSVVHGQYPTKSQQRLLRDAFGDLAAEDLVSSVPWLKHFGAGALNLVGIPRAVMASLDMSAPLRQGLVLGVTHPVIWGKNFPKMIKSFGNTGVYEAVQHEVAARPNFELYQRGRVPFTDLNVPIGKREEQFASSWAETVTGGKYSFVRASNRAYVAFLNKSRADLFDWLLKEAEKYHPEINLDTAEGQKMLEEFGQIVGRATGRGTVKHFEEAMPFVNQIFFAPRLLKSRLDVLASPVNALRMTPVARREAFKQLAGLVATVGSVLTLATWAGAKVSRDPTNADWLKIKIGNTRFDIAAGFQQPLRLMAQVAEGKITSSTTGKTINLGAGGGYGHLTGLDIALRFAETKLAPVPSLGVDLLRGSDFVGKPFNTWNALYQRLTPLLLQDAIDLYRQGNNSAGNIALASALYGVGFWGIGAQTYGPKKTKKFVPSGGIPDYAKVGGTGTSPYAQPITGSSDAYNP